MLTSEIMIIISNTVAPPNASSSPLHNEGKERTCDNIYELNPTSPVQPTASTNTVAN